MNSYSCRRIAARRTTPPWEVAGVAQYQRRWKLAEFGSLSTLYLQRVQPCAVAAPEVSARMGVAVGC
jgi:hypothetical protein